MTERRTIDKAAWAEELTQSLAQTLDSSESYDNTSCCGEDCSWLGIEGMCWGAVEVVGEEQFGHWDYTWVHSCQGHIALYDESGTYNMEMSCQNEA